MSMKIKASEKTNISKFVLNLNEKNYSQANKYLRKILESKLNKRIDKTINNL